MALAILEEHPKWRGGPRGDIRKVGEQWAMTQTYLGYWIGGFESQRDALLVQEAIDKAVQDGKEAVMWS